MSAASVEGVGGAEVVDLPRWSAPAPRSSTRNLVPAQKTRGPRVARGRLGDRDPPGTAHRGCLTGIPGRGRPSGRRRPSGAPPAPRGRPRRPRCGRPRRSRRAAPPPAPAAPAGSSSGPPSSSATRSPVWRQPEGAKAPPPPGSHPAPVSPADRTSGRPRSRCPSVVLREAQVDAAVAGVQPAAGDRLLLGEEADAVRRSASRVAEQRLPPARRRRTSPPAPGSAR